MARTIWFSSSNTLFPYGNTKYPSSLTDFNGLLLALVWLEQKNISWNERWFSFFSVFVCLFLELGQLSGVAAILRFPMPDIANDEDSAEESEED